VTVGEAKGLVARLSAAYPMAKVGADTASVWIAELRPLELGLAKEAVENVIRSVKFFPSIAELAEAVMLVREQRARRQREDQRQAAVEAEAVMEPLSPEILREMHAYSARLAGRPELTEVEPGVCDDCGDEGLRFRFAALSVCSSCGASRAGAAVRLIQGDVTMARRWAHDEGPDFSDDAVARRLEEMLPDERFADLRIELADEVADLRRENAA
jgi:hypothetical protein